MIQRISTTHIGEFRQRLSINDYRSAILVEGEHHVQDIGASNGLIR